MIKLMLFKGFVNLLDHPMRLDCVLAYRLMSLVDPLGLVVTNP